MKALKTFALLLFVAMFAFACGDDGDDNPADNGGNNNNNTSGASSKGSLGTHTGNNTVVTSDNAQEVSGIIMGKASEVFSRALQLAVAGKPAAGTTMNIDGKVNGDKGGYAQSKGSMSYSTTGATSYNITCTFYDFSDDGALWLGGQITYTGTMSYSTTSYTYNLKYTGGLKFNGTYDGAEDFVMNYSLNGSSITYNGTMTITSGGKTFNYTYKYPL